MPQFLAELIFYIVLAVIGLGFFFLILALNKRAERGMTTQDFCVRLPMLLTIMALILSLAFLVGCVCTLMYVQTSGKYAGAVVLGSLFLISANALFVCIRKKIFVHQNVVTYVPAYGRTRKIDLQIIDRVRMRSIDEIVIVYKVYAGTKLFSFANYYVGCKLFLQAIEGSVEVTRR